MASVDPWIFLVISFGLGILPMAVVMTTSFTKISIILALLRNSLGVQQAPSNLALSGIALAVTMLIMAPVVKKIDAELNVDSLVNGERRISASQLIDAVRPPITEFMLAHVDMKELKALEDLTKERHLDDRQEDVSVTSDELPTPKLTTLISAFVISEVASAFKIGMYLALGFAVVDLIVANLLMAMGMTMFPPTTVSIPLKLMVFVVSSGFARTIHGVIQSY
ncbi:EscR/YscR/HrcR family type III secretion system export apparatus protein [Dyella sp.]|uniref:EscR/YscR/HrcR family type III secretion system export apparatus protein n=1 Tax=Dyella sp. TaxID=1869338 RepID=UPI002ECFDB25